MATITLRGTPVHTIGSLPAIGSQAPDFTVTDTDLGEIHLKNYLGRKIILNFFPSLDTAVCALTLVNFNKMALENPNMLIICISADLPFAQKRFCADQRLENIFPASVFRHPNLGKDYGIEIIDGPLTGLLARAVVVIDEHGKIIHTEQVEELTNEPDYEAISQAVKG